MKRLFLSIVAMMMCCSAAMAVPAKPIPFTHVQSDGTTVTLMMHGGKFNHALMTLDGLTVAMDEKGDYCYTASGHLSDVLAHDQGHRGIQETAFITAYRNQMSIDSSRHPIPRREESNSNPQVPTLGSPRIPIILVNYTDVKFIDTNPIETFENQFNEKEYSCLHYFENQSRGKFSPKFEILGPVELSYTRAFYGGNDNHGYDMHLGDMIIEACEGIDDSVDFANYDNDGDGLVDVVVVLFAGVGEAQAWRTVPESVWPCQWDMQECYEWGYSPTGPFQLDGMTIDKFAVFNELEGSTNSSTNIDGVGTFCHEFSHCLGLPDFYHTANGFVYGMSSWDIMDHGCYNNNSHTPAGYSSYERHYMGWMDLIDPVENTKYTLAPLNSPEGTAVKVVNDANSDEYYLLEYRKLTGWDAYLAAEGILILHVDYDKNAWDNNTPNNIGSHPRMSIIPADNVLTGFSNSTDTWPLAAKDSLTNYSIPAATVYQGGYMNKPITRMRIDSVQNTASFWYMKAASTVFGDVDGDGEVNISDISAIIDILLRGGSDSDMSQADVNGDGEVNIADINSVIDIILKS